MAKASVGKGVSGDWVIVSGTTLFLIMLFLLRGGLCWVCVRFRWVDATALELAMTRTVGGDAALPIPVGRKTKQRLAQALIDLRNRDPQFALATVLPRAERAFSAIQDAWSNQDLGPVQPFLSDAVFERFSLQISDLRRRKVRDVMKDLSVSGSQVVAIDSDEHYDVMHVLITASGINFREHLETREFLEGSDTQEAFSEVWSFVRRGSARTSGKSGLIEGSCPNCGTTIGMQRAATCPSCQSFLRSGEHDWVLAEITQTCEWNFSIPTGIGGLSEMVARDPGFNVQQLEDRASVVFWRRQDCYRKRSTEPLLRHAAPEYLADFAKELRPDKQGHTPVFINPAVGSVDVRRITCESTCETVAIEIRWSAEPAMLDKKGQIVNQQGGTKNSHDSFVFMRKPGVKTDLRLAFSSSHCPGCGAPETNATDNVCPYCQAAVNDGSSGWTLLRIFRG